jgi:hypothetical protein
MVAAPFAGLSTRGVEAASNHCPPLNRERLFRPTEEIPYSATWKSYANGLLFEVWCVAEKGSERTYEYTATKVNTTKDLYYRLTTDRHEYAVTEGFDRFVDSYLADAYDYKIFPVYRASELTDDFWTQDYVRTSWIEQDEYPFYVERTKDKLRHGLGALLEDGEDGTQFDVLVLGQGNEEYPYSVAFAAYPPIVDGHWPLSYYRRFAIEEVDTFDLQQTYEAFKNSYYNYQERYGDELSPSRTSSHWVAVN